MFEFPWLCYRVFSWPQPVLLSESLESSIRRHCIKTTRIEKSMEELFNVKAEKKSFTLKTSSAWSFRMASLEDWKTQVAMGLEDKQTGVHRRRWIDCCSWKEYAFHAFCCRRLNPVSEVVWGWSGSTGRIKDNIVFEPIMMAIDDGSGFSKVVRDLLNLTHSKFRIGWVYISQSCMLLLFIQYQ